MDKKRTLGTTAGMLSAWREAAGEAKSPSWEEQERAAREKAKVGVKPSDAVQKWREITGATQPAPQATQTASTLFQSEAERMDEEAAVLRAEAQREYHELMNKGE